MRAQLSYAVRAAPCRRRRGARRARPPLPAAVGGAPTRTMEIERLLPPEESPARRHNT